MLTVVIPSATHHIQMPPWVVIPSATMAITSTTKRWTQGNHICQLLKQPNGLPMLPTMALTSALNTHMAITSAITYGNNICHYICGLKYATAYKNNLPKVVAKTSATVFRHNISLIVIWLNICHNKLCQYMCLKLQDTPTSIHHQGLE